MNQDKWKSLLGLANRARKITSGEELVTKEIRNKKAKLVLLASDASANTYKKVTNKAAFYQVEVREVPSRYELGAAIGKEARVVVAVLDNGFAQSLLKVL